MNKISKFNKFQPTVVFHIEPSHLFCTSDQMIGYYVTCNTGLKWIKILRKEKKMDLLDDNAPKFETISGTQKLMNEISRVTANKQKKL